MNDMAHLRLNPFYLQLGPFCLHTFTVDPGGWLLNLGQTNISYFSRHGKYRKKNDGFPLSIGSNVWPIKNYAHVKVGVFRFKVVNK